MYFHHFAHELAFLAVFGIFRAKTLSKIVKNAISDNPEIPISQWRITEFPVISYREEFQPPEVRLSIGQHVAAHVSDRHPRKWV